MKILLVTDRFPPLTRGGAELLASDVAHELRRRGHVVTVLTASLQAAQESIAEWVQPLLPDTGASNTTETASGRLQGCLRFYRRHHSNAAADALAEAVGRLEPHVIYVWGLDGVGTISLLRQLACDSHRVVFHLNNYWWQYLRDPQTAQSRVRARWLKRLLIGRLPTLRYTSMIAVSEHVKREYASVGCDPTRIEVVPNAVADVFFDAPRRREPSAECVTLTYVGRLSAEKGVDVAIEALSLLMEREARQRFRLRLVGDGTTAYVGALRQLVRDRHLEDVVSFEGWCTREALVEVYDASTVCLVPSVWAEPFGLVAAEAMTRGVPVVASRVGGLSEVIKDGHDGLLVRPGVAHEMATAVRALCQNESQRNRLAKAGERSARSRFRLAECAARVERHLGEAVDGVMTKGQSSLSADATTSEAVMGVLAR
jgi:glycosyltransferase involved in cell wall biosynthesis